MGLWRPFWRAIRLSRAYDRWAGFWTDRWVHDHEEGEPCGPGCFPTRPGPDVQGGVARSGEDVYPSPTHNDTRPKDT